VQPANFKAEKFCYFLEPPRHQNFNGYQCTKVHLFILHDHNAPNDFREAYWQNATHVPHI